MLAIGLEYNVDVKCSVKIKLKATSMNAFYFQQ
jgi:hypothetical protein